MVVYRRQKYDFEAILGGKLCLEAPRCPDRYAQIRQVPCPDRCGQRVLRLLSGVLVTPVQPEMSVQIDGGAPWRWILVSQAGAAGNCRCTDSTWLRVRFSLGVSYFLWLWSSVIHPLYCWELAQSLSNFIVLLAEDCLISVRGRDYICSFIYLE